MPAASDTAFPPFPEQRTGAAGTNSRDEKILRGIEAMEKLEQERAAYFAGMLDGPEPPLDW